MVGSGGSINLWTEPWFSTTSPLSPMGPPTKHNQHLCVSDLLHPHSREWNVAAIREHLPQYEEKIRALIPSQYHMEDELVWLPEKSGSYSTKTGYALCKLTEGHEDLTFNWRKYIWNVKTSPKLKHFPWKIKNRALPLGEHLLRRGMEVDGRCKRCGVLETDRHVFMQNPFPVCVWDLITVMFKPNPSSISTPISLSVTCDRLVNLPPSGLSIAALHPWVLWYLWSARNKLLYENLMLSEQDVATLALKESRTWQAAQAERPTVSTSKQGYKGPMIEGSKQVNHCYVDAAWNATARSGGFGCIFKTQPNNDKPFHQFSANRCFVGSIFIAEALAVKTALLEAVNLGLRTLTVLSDSQSLITAISSKGRIVEPRGILFDIAHLCCFFSSVSFHFIPRLKNVEADALAKLALSNLVYSV